MIINSETPKQIRIKNSFDVLINVIYLRSYVLKCANRFTENFVSDANLDIIKQLSNVICNEFLEIKTRNIEAILLR